MLRVKIYAELIGKKYNYKNIRIKSLMDNKIVHIHIGYANNNIDTSLWLVKYLDHYLGVPSVLKDKDKRRRSLYGKAGCFRLTSYGVEYRVLSSTLMKNNDSLEFVWNQLSKAINAYNRGYDLPDSSLVIEAINNSDTELAKKLISTYDLIN